MKSTTEKAGHTIAAPCVVESPRTSDREQMTDHQDGAVMTREEEDLVEIGLPETVAMTTVDRDTRVGVASMVEGDTEEVMVAAVVVVTDSRVTAATEGTMTKDMEVVATTVEISGVVEEIIEVSRGKETMAAVATASSTPMGSSSMEVMVTRADHMLATRATARATRHRHSRATSRVMAHISSTLTTTRDIQAAATEP